VYAFEANPQNADLIVRSVRENRLENVEVLTMALGNQEGQARLGLADRSDQHSIVGKSLNAIEVPVTSLDSFAAARDLPRLDMLNIDVEGAEMLVIEGGRQAIARFRPYLLLSYHPRKSPNARKIGDLLAALGYKFADVRDPEAPLDSFPLDPCNVCAWPAGDRQRNAA
jgi:FkbM family methyltransferase